MKIILLRDPEFSRQESECIQKLLSDLDGQSIAVEVKDNPEIRFKQDRPSFKAILEELNAKRRGMGLGEQDFLVYLSPRPNFENWFSASSYSSGRTRNIYIQTSEWDFFVLSSPQVAVAYQVVGNILHLCVFDSIEDAVKRAHEPPIGCACDMCRWKVDVSLKMRTADICINCAQRAESILGRGAVSQLLRLLERLRGKSLMTNRPLSGDGRMEAGEFYPIAITKRRMKNEQEPLRRFYRLIDYFDALIRCASYILSATHLNDRGQNVLMVDVRPNKTLGWWFYRFKDLLGANLDQQSAADALRMIESDPQVRGVIDVRNEYRGHGYCNQCDRQFSEVFNAYWPVVERFEAYVLHILAPYKFLFVQNSRQLPGGVVEYRVLKLHGEHPDFLGETVQCQHNPVLYDHGIFAHESATGRWIDMVPLIKFTECSACHHSRLLLWDGNHYLDPDCGRFANPDL